MQPRTGAVLAVVGMAVLVTGAVVSGSWLVGAISVGPFLTLAWCAVHFGRPGRSPSA